MLIYTIIIAIVLSAIFLFFKGSKTPSINTEVNKKNEENNDATENYKNLKTHLEKLFLNKREQKSRPKLSLTLNKLFLDNNKNEISRQFSIEIILQRFLLNFDVYAFYINESKENLESNDIFEKIRTIIGPHRLMSCTTKDGLIAMIRQLNAKFHIETNLFVLQNLKNIVRFIYFSEEKEENNKISSDFDKNSVEIFSDFEGIFMRLDNHFLS